MRFLSADWVFPLYKEPIKEGVISVNEDGSICNIFDCRSMVKSENVEIFNGVICPGFINAHCHLELSHLSGLFTPSQGFIEFLDFIKIRNDFSKKQIYDSIRVSEKQMMDYGIVGVGDICNTSDTINQKKKRNLEYYNFIEIFEVDNKKLDDKITKSLVLRKIFRELKFRSTIVPHAMYSLVPELMNKIYIHSDKNDEIFSIHNQEILDENRLFNSNNGDLFLWLKSIGASDLIWGKQDSSKKRFYQLFENKKKLFVHNTFSCHQDILDNGLNYYCTCPRANLYIENNLPNYKFFNPDRLCVGTDSLASNWDLSIFEELKVIKKHSDFDWNTLFKIASKNGAEALGFKNLGTFMNGKIPGVNLISSDFSSFLIRII